MFLYFFHSIQHACKIVFYDKEAALKLGFLGGVSTMMPGLDMTVKVIGLVITFIVAANTVYCNLKRLEMDRERLKYDIQTKTNKDGEHQSEQRKESSPKEVAQV